MTRILATLMPDEPEVLGLLALMLLTDARRPSRVAGGALVALPDQDRARWDAGPHHRGPRHRPTLPAPRADPAATRSWPPSTRCTPMPAALRGDRLAADRRAVRPAVRRRPDPGRCAQPGHRGGGGGRTGRRRSPSWTRFSWTVITPTRPPARICSAGPATCRPRQPAYRRALELARNPAEQAFLRGRLDELAGRTTPTG